MLIARVRWIALAVVIITPGVASAQSPCGDLRAKVLGDKPLGQGDNRLALLSLAYAANCLGESEDLATPVTRKVADRLPETRKGKGSDSEERALVIAALDDIRGAIVDRRRAEVSGRPADAALGELLTLLSTAHAAVAVGSNSNEAPVLGTRSWQWDTGLNEFLEPVALPVRQAIATACGQPGPICDMTYGDAVEILRAARLVERTLQFYGADLLTAAAMLAKQRDRQWTAYFDDTLPQFPWEVALNSIFFSGVARETGGFAFPPSQQGVFLHPTAGLEYVRGNAAGDRFKPAVMLEVFGYNRWIWNSDQEPSHALGVSGVVVFSDQAEVASVGYGVLFRYAHKYSVAVTRRSRRTGIVLSLDLGQWVQTASQKAKDAMRLVGR